MSFFVLYFFFFVDDVVFHASGDEHYAASNSTAEMSTILLSRRCTTLYTGLFDPHAVSGEMFQISVDMSTDVAIPTREPTALISGLYHALGLIICERGTLVHC